MNQGLHERFSGKVAVVTGAGSGIGRATALRLAAEGASLVLIDLANGPLADCAAAIEHAGGHAVAVEGDVTSRADIERYVRTAIAKFGGIDIFFNNAGILGVVSPLLEYPEDMFDKVIAVNVKAVWLGMKLVAPAIIARGGGVIVNTASIAGIKGSAGLMPYSASKHAVIGMTRSAALELAPHKVRVNAVCPAPIDTPMGTLLDQGYGPKDAAAAHERIVGRIPLGRYGTAEEVAGVVAFLCCADASFVNGAAYTIDGGQMA